MKNIAPSKLSLPKRLALAVAVSAASFSVANATTVVVQTNSFTMASNSILNMKDNVLIIHNIDGTTANATLAAVTADLARGINLANSGWWDAPANPAGGSIVSSVAALTNGTFTESIGVTRNDFQGNPIYATFFGVTVTDFDVLVRYTLSGDADLSGTVDSTDQFLLDQGAAGSLTGWLNGDNDYSGGVDSTDQFLLDQGASHAPLMPPPPPFAAVPEPSSMILMTVSLLGLAVRRKNRL